MRKIVLTFGLIAGAMLSAMMLLTMPFHDEIGFERGLVIGYTTMVLSFLMVYFGVRSYRDNVAGGTVTFGRAFTVGMLIALIGAVCYVITWEVLYFNFMPDFMENMTAHTLDRARASGATEAEIAQQARELADFAVQYRNPFVNAAYTFLEPLPVGLLFALGSAGILSRRRTASRSALA